MMDGQSFLCLAIPRQACCFTTITTAHSRKWEWKREWPSTGTGANERAWGLTPSITMGTAGWTSSRQIFRTIPRHSFAITVMEPSRMSPNRQDSAPTHSSWGGEHYSWTSTMTDGQTFFLRTGTFTQRLTEGTSARAFEREK